VVEIGFVELISNVGFPIAVSLYFMFRVDKSLKNLTSAVSDLKEAIRENRL